MGAVMSTGFAPTVYFDAPDAPKATNRLQRRAFRKILAKKATAKRRNPPRSDT